LPHPLRPLRAVRTAIHVLVDAPEIRADLSRIKVFSHIGSRRNERTIAVFEVKKEFRLIARTLPLLRPSQGMRKP
jgi:hypothetical protein